MDEFDSEYESKNNNKEATSSFMWFDSQDKIVKAAIITAIMSIIGICITGCFNIFIAVIQATSQSSKPEASPVPIVITTTPLPTYTPYPSTVTNSTPEEPEKIIIIVTPTPEPGNMQWLTPLTGVKLSPDSYFGLSIVISIIIVLLTYASITSMLSDGDFLVTIGIGIYIILVGSLVIYLYLKQVTMGWIILATALAVILCFIILSQGKYEQSSCAIILTLYALVGVAPVLYAGWTQQPSLFSNVPITLAIGYPVTMFALSKL